jgi:hypothetical protein
VTRPNKPSATSSAVASTVSLPLTQTERATPSQMAVKQRLQKRQTEPDSDRLRKLELRMKGIRNWNDQNDA